MARHHAEFRRKAAQGLPLLVLLIVGSAAQAAPALDEAERLIASGRAAEALALLSRNELQYAGSARFDYLYGVAALDSGRHAAAIEALERAVAAAPEDPAARLELGRARFESGDRTGAQSQFQWLVTRDSPPRIRDAARAYLLAMEPRRDSGEGGWTGRFDFTTGYDSNANASTDDGEFFGVTLDPDNVETHSAFAGVSLVGRYVGRVGERSRLSTDARIGHRWNENAGFVDQTIASLDTLLDVGSGPTVFSLGAGGYYGLLDGDAHQWGASADAGLSRRFGDDWLARGQLRYGIVRYDEDFGTLSVLDYDRTQVALTLWRSLEDDGFGLTAIAGWDDPQASGSPYKNERLGLQFDAVLQGAGGRGLQFQLGWLEADYDEDTPFFGVLDRSDEVWSAVVAGDIPDWPARGWHLVPRASWVNNDSTISLYQYDRFQFGLAMQRAFR